MHIYHLGISSVSLPLPPMEESAPEPGLPQQNKRSRELPLSPSPASVMTDEHNTMMMMMMTSPAAAAATATGQDMMLFESPAAKRKCLEAPANRSAEGNSNIQVHHQSAFFMPTTNTTASASSHHVSPEVSVEHAPLPRARNVVSMERDDQCEWWKAPPTAPQLLPASTMGLSSSSNANSTSGSSGVLGCNACQRMFVPPTITVATPQNTLLNYFETSKPKPPPPAPASSQQVLVDRDACLCTFCERSTCASCFRTCEKCQHGFCTLCSTQAYVPGNPSQEETLCLDCASMLDLGQSNNAMMED